MRTWILSRPDGIALGQLTEDGRDAPWVLCRFEPTPEFGEVAELFAEDLGLLDEDEMDAWEMVHGQIAALGLELRPLDGREPIRDFVLHVDGERAWFRS